MERNYSEQPSADFRTPRLRALQVPDKKLLIQIWVCSPDNTLDQDRWFYQVEVIHTDDGQAKKINRHHFLTFPEALRFRSHVAGIDHTYLLSEQNDDIMGILTNRVPEKTITRIDFADTPIWEGYTLQEVLNIRG